MKFTFDWLQDHLKTDLTYCEIAEKLTSLGIEVEEIIDNSKKFEKFTVGYIEKADKHPNADRLRVCEVNIGDKILQIVCGAPNARAGIYVIVALVGAIIPIHGETLKKGVIRGIESNGMMCSSRELLLGDDADGIIELPKSVIPGQNVISALGIDDVIFDVSITPNRADCFSVRGIARDLAAIGAGELIELNNFNISENIENPITVDLESKNCSYFSTVAIQNVSGQTPEYIAKRLKAIGQNLVSMPVDVANYVCFDIGQPLHIYDMDTLSKKLVIRDSKNGEEIETLNHKRTVLPDESIVVTDGDDVISIAGIMGGTKTGYSSKTNNILVESAYFDKIAISKTGQTLRINSDSRTRFERGIDPENVDYALKYVAKLISKCCDCKFSNITKYGKLPENKFEIEVSYKKFNTITGLSNEIFKNSVNSIKKLGITIKHADTEKMIVTTPSWRYDLRIEEDIIEEILRLNGFENIKEEDLPIELKNQKTYTIDKLSDALIYNGYYEVKTFSFLDQTNARKLSSDNELVKLKETSNEISILRPTIVATHLKAIQDANNKSQKDLRIFEFGKSFKRDGNKIIETSCITATLSGKLTPRNWRERQKDVSIYDIKEDLERLLNMLGLKYRLKLNAPAYYHPGRSGTYIYQKDTVIAHFGEINPQILLNLGITDRVVCFELFTDKLPEFFDEHSKKTLELSQYQPIKRDFSFVVQNEILASDIINAITKLHIDEVQNITIFDIYKSPELGDTKKAVAIEILLQSKKQTLDEETISNISNKIIVSVSKNCSGELRKQQE